MARRPIRETRKGGHRRWDVQREQEPEGVNTDPGASLLVGERHWNRTSERGQRILRAAVGGEAEMLLSAVSARCHSASFWKCTKG